MTTILAPYANLADAVLDLAIATMPSLIPDDDHTGSETPANMQTRLEGGLLFLRAVRVGGIDNRITDHAAIDCDIFALTYAAASDGAEILRGVLLGYPHRVGSTNGTGGVVIDSVFTEIGPRELPWENGAVRRFGATYQLSARR